MTSTDLNRKTTSFVDLDDVTIKKAVTDLFDGHIVPAGSTGNIVCVDIPGVGYTVELPHPIAALAEVMHDQIA